MSFSKPPTDIRDKRAYSNANVFLGTVVLQLRGGAGNYACILKPGISGYCVLPAKNYEQKLQGFKL